MGPGHDVNAQNDNLVFSVSFTYYAVCSLNVGCFDFPLTKGISLEIFAVLFEDMWLWLTFVLF